MMIKTKRKKRNGRTKRKCHATKHTNQGTKKIMPLFCLEFSICLYICMPWNSYWKIIFLLRYFAVNKLNVINYCSTRSTWASLAWLPRWFPILLNNCLCILKTTCPISFVFLLLPYFACTQSHYDTRRCGRPKLLIKNEIGIQRCAYPWVFETACVSYWHCRCKNRTSFRILIYIDWNRVFLCEKKN